MNLTSYTPLLIGPAVSLGLWYHSVSSMEGVGKRINSLGNETNSNQSLIEYIKLPFSLEKAPYAWGTAPNIPLQDRAKILSTNWLVMGSLGLGTGALIYKCLL